MNNACNPRSSKTGKIKYQIDAFSKVSVGSAFPEFSWYAGDGDELDEIVGHLCEPGRGFVVIEIWWYEPDDNNTGILMASHHIKS